MITHKSTLSLDRANIGKINHLNSFIAEFQRITNEYITIFWENRIFSGNYVPKAIYDLVEDTWLSSAMKQCSALQALQIIKSQRKRKKKTKPIFRNFSITLDQRFVGISLDKPSASFDAWLKLKNIGVSGKFFLPSNRHIHLNPFVDSDEWVMKKSIKLKRRLDGRFFVDLIFERGLSYKSDGNAVAIDTGYNNLGVTSDGQVVGTDLSTKIDKITRKVQGSKAFKRALVERNDYIRRETKTINLNGIKDIVLEDLTGIKIGRTKFSKKFRNKYQHWNFKKFQMCVAQHSEVGGVHCHYVNPAYTSQTCSLCGNVDRSNRRGSIFKCVICGNTEDADRNASRNILQRFIRLQESTDSVTNNV